MKYVLLLSSLSLAMMSTAQAYNVSSLENAPENGLANSANVQLIDNGSSEQIGLVEAFAIIPGLTETEFRAADLNQNMKLDAYELARLSSFRASL